MKRFFLWCKRYISVLSILVIAFIVYMMFFQNNSIFKYMEYSRTIDSLRTEIKMYTDTMNYYHRQNEILTHDPEVMERIVREQYHMNRENEDVYIFK